MDFQPFIKAFLPLFVAIDVIGILPLFVGITRGMDAHNRNKLALEAILAAFILAFLILFSGNMIFRVLGIQLHDLQVGGGIILLVLSINDLLFSDFQRRNPKDEADYTVGVVPLGIPLVMGPSAITTIMISQQSFGYGPTLFAMVANLLIVLVVFYFGPRLLHYLGTGTTKAIAKVVSLFLAAIAIAMIRSGVSEMIRTFNG
ncbi:MAG: MarC family protein [Rhodothermia bacterium]|nr:MarC family protein [Rhodothermia bacterium]